MSAADSCPCLDPACLRCGARPVVLWGDEPAETDRSPPRTDPPGHAEAIALSIYERVATRRTRRRPRHHRAGILSGSALLATAAVIYHFDWDLSLLRLVSLGLAGFGLVKLLKGVLGHGGR